MAQGSTDPHSNFWGTVFRTVSMSVIDGLGAVGALALAWRMTGARIEFSKLLVAYCYISGVCFVLGSVLILATTGMLRTLYPETYPAFERAAETAPRVFSPKYTESIEALRAMPDVEKFGKITFSPILLPLLWAFGAWGTYRHLAEVGRLRSATALAIFILLLLFLWGPLMAFMEWGGKSGG